MQFTMVMNAKHARSSSTRTDSGFAFLPEPTTGLRSARSEDAAFLGEEFVASALTGESLNEDVRDEVVEEGEGFHVIAEDELDGTMADSTLDVPSTGPRSDMLAGEPVMRGGLWVARGT